MPSVQTRFIILLLLTVAGLHSGMAQEQVFRHDYADLPDTFVEVSSVFGTAARQGSLPFRVTIRNNSGEDREWILIFQEGNSGQALTTKADSRIAVENGSEVVREVTLPVAPPFLAYDYRTLNLWVSSKGVPTERRSHSTQSNQFFPTLAISAPLARRSLANLDDVVKKADPADHAFAKPFEADHLPNTWLGYTGLDALLIDLPSWQALSVMQRQALTSWVRLGGRVDIYTDTEANLSALRLPTDITPSDTEKVSLSLGEIRLLRWDGIELGDDIVETYRAIPIRSRSLDQEFSNNWGLQKEFGIREFNPTIIFLLLVVFAILVAPVNLFYLAGPGRRHRLFITTPLISIATCLVIVVVILFIDGVGGRGIRVVVADLQPAPGEMRLYLSQEQISRTGVMTNTGFRQGSEYDITPVNLPPSGFNPFSQNHRNSISYEFIKGEFAGGFFQSRAEQAFSIRSVEATRSRIELDYPSGKQAPPTLVSNLSQPLSKLLYIDQDGEIWISKPGATITPGAEIVLEKPANKEWPDWMEETTSRVSETLRNQVEAMKVDRNRFFAVPATHDGFALPTHPGIEWEKTVLLLTGTPLSLNPAAELPAAPAIASPDTNE